MNQNGNRRGTQAAGGGMAYRGLSLTQLALSVSAGDKAALDEILGNRPLFHFGERHGLLLPEFLYEVRQYYAFHRKGDATETIDRAYDLALDKFSNLPSCARSGQAHARDHGGSRNQGPDCRRYYAAFLEFVDETGKTCPQLSPIGQENFAGNCLQRFVIRHFHFSRLEAKRIANPFISRYVWSIKGRGDLALWMPRALYRQERRVWLEENIEDPNPGDPGERERVQAIIDGRLVMPHFVPLDGFERYGPRDKVLPPWASFDEEEPDIGEYVAREKALSFKRQRPAIRRLGPARIEALVRSCFRNAATREKSDEQLAHEFGLSKSTFSRFAGSLWHGGANGRNPEVPDLWANTAHVLATDPVFVKLAGTSGSRPLTPAITKAGLGRQLRGNAP